MAAYELHEDGRPPMFIAGAAFIDPEQRHALEAPPTETAPAVEVATVSTEMIDEIMTRHEEDLARRMPPAA